MSSSPDTAPGVRRRFLVRPEDRLNLIRAALSVPILLLPAATGLPAGGAGFAYGVAVWFLLSDTNFLLHQHVHRPLTLSPAVNRGLDWLLSAATGMSAYNWRQQHVLRHHRGDDSWGKAFEWEFRRPTLIGAVSYGLRGVPIVFARPLWEAFVRGVLRNDREPVRFRAAFVEQACVAAFAGTLIAREPAFYGPYYFLVLFFTRVADYETHAGCDESAYGFANNTLSAAYNRVRNNFGYHTAHHLFPDAHWSELPTRHAAIADRVPAERLGRKPWTGMWTPPGLTHLLGRLTALLRTTPSVRRHADR